MAGLIGVFGGTFDPPHVGHLILASEAFHQLQFDRLLWVLTADPPHKQGCPIAPVSQRLDLLQAALAGNLAFELSRVDIDRPAPHYALDTLRILRGQNPGAALVYLMGGDSLQDLPTWHKPQEFLAACDAIGVMCRPGYDSDLAELESQLPGLTAKVRWIDTPRLEISSSKIRKRIAQGGAFRYYLTPPVYQLIQERHLYRPPTQVHPPL